MPPAMFGRSAKPLSGRYLSFGEREEIALLRAQGNNIQEVARRLGRAASTISRELRRNAATRSGGLKYRATTAQWHAERAARRPKQGKLALNAALQAYVEERLAGVGVAPSGVLVHQPGCEKYGWGDHHILAEGFLVNVSGEGNGPFASETGHDRDRTASVQDQCEIQFDGPRAPGA